MRPERRLLLLTGFLVMVAVILGIVLSHKGAPKMEPNPTNSTSSLQIASQVFRDGGNIPVPYTCKGQNVNPPLNIGGVLGNAKSLAMIVHDPDAPGGDFVHWLMWDIPTSTATIAVNGVPAGAVQGLNGSGQNKYMGPCPPAGTGTHHYIFELYALDAPLANLGKDTSRDQLKTAMNGHIVDQTKLTGLFAAD